MGKKYDGLREEFSSYIARTNMRFSELGREHNDEMRKLRETASVTANSLSQQLYSANMRVQELQQGAENAVQSLKEHVEARRLLRDALGYKDAREDALNWAGKVVWRQDDEVVEPGLVGLVEELIALAQRVPQPAEEPKAIDPAEITDLLRPAKAWLGDGPAVIHPSPFRFPPIPVMLTRPAVFDDRAVLYGGMGGGKSDLARLSSLLPHGRSPIRADAFRSLFGQPNPIIAEMKRKAEVKAKLRAEGVDSLSAVVDRAVATPSAPHGACRSVYLRDIYSLVRDADVGFSGDSRAVRALMLDRGYVWWPWVNESEGRRFIHRDDLTRGDWSRIVVWFLDDHAYPHCSADDCTHLLVDAAAVNDCFAEMYGAEAAGREIQSGARSLWSQAMQDQKTYHHVQAPAVWVRKREA